MSRVIGAVRKSQFKTHANYPDLCNLPFDNVVKHLLYHVLPLGWEHEWVLDRNIEKVCKSIDQFNGKRIVAIATAGNGDTKPFICPDNVIDKFDRFGGKDIEFVFVQNVKRLREVTSFLKMLNMVMTDDPNHVVFYGHCKGVTHPNPESVCHTWADVMYETVYNNWEQVKGTLQDRGICGSFKKYGTFRTPLNHRWHYSGTFYWFRCASVFVRNWKRVDQAFYGVESWPGLIFKPEEAACLFHDNTKDLYKVSKNYLIDKLQEWRAQKISASTCTRGI